MRSDAALPTTAEGALAPNYITVDASGESFDGAAKAVVGPPGLGGDVYHVSGNSCARQWWNFCDDFPCDYTRAGTPPMDHEIYAQINPSLRKTCVDDFPSSVPMGRTQCCIDRQGSCEQQFRFASKWWNPCDDEGSFWSPVSYGTPAPVREYIALALSCDAAFAPVGECFSPAPGGYAALAPVVDHTAPVLAVYAAPTPVVEFISPSPGGYTAPAHVADYIAIVPPRWAAPTPVVEYLAPVPPIRSTNTWNKCD